MIHSNHIKHIRGEGMKNFKKNNKSMMLLLLGICIIMIGIFIDTSILQDISTNVDMNNNDNREYGFSSPMGNNDSIQNEEKNKEDIKEELIDFNGNVEHIFFHPLVVYKELAFDGDYQSKSMDDWFVTVKEFKEILKQLYKNNYILIDINSIYETKKENNKEVMARKSIKIPKGKKPLIISIDDMNYYEYMIKNGTIHKLVLDQHGNIASYTNTKDGKHIIEYDNSIVTILDSFVNENPDFSLNGAKATIALTGYEGILGYRTNNGNKDKDTEIQKVRPIIKRLKETGWNFASHSYGHPDVSEISYEKLKDDTDKWEMQVQSLIGETKVYIYPFGSSLKYRDSKLQYLKNKGFKIFCGVGPSSYEELINDTVQTDRRHVDGISLRNQREKFLDLYDSNTVLDLEGRKTIK